MQARRLASYVIDLLFVGAPWVALLGFAVDGRGGGMASLGLVLGAAVLCTLATLGLLVVEAVLFAARRRTLGMAAVGLVAAAGSRGLALFLGALVVVAPVGVALLLAGLLGGEAQRALGVAAPLGAIAFELAFALAPGARTLSDRMAGLRWERDAQPTVPRGAAVVLDAAVLALAGAPVLLVFDWDDAAGAVVASALMVFLLFVLELITLARTRGTLAMRALGPRTA